MSKITILVGAQWGDEGKGKWVDILSEKIDIIARYQGGNNAGHTLYVDGEKVVLHQLPSGVFRKDKISALLPGVVINPVGLAEEIKNISNKVSLSSENFWISEKAHIITPFHIMLDSKNERVSSKPIGTTKRGIGPSYCAKYERTGLRMQTFLSPDSYKTWLKDMLANSDLFKQSYEENSKAWKEFESTADVLRTFSCPTEQKIRSMLKKGYSLLLEGAQGTLLDINHGTYPYVTSSSTISGGAIASLGIDPRSVSKIYGVAKAYVTRVGEGPFPTELKGPLGEQIQQKGQEFGATTSRTRRCGWFDAVAMRHAAQINGLDEIYLNKLDILSGISELKIAHSYTHPTLGELKDFPSDHEILADCVPNYEDSTPWKEEIVHINKYEDLPKETKSFIKHVEKLSEVRVGMIGTGPQRSDFVEMPA